MPPNESNQRPSITSTANRTCVQAVVFALVRIYDFLHLSLLLNLRWQAYHSSTSEWPSEIVWVKRVFVGFTLEADIYVL